MKYTVISLMAILLLFAVSCMEYGPFSEEDISISASKRGVFIVNEGNFMYGNASLSFYDIDSEIVENNLFSRSNGISPGDVAMSMTIKDGKCYIVVNNSGIVFVADVNTLKVAGTITGLVSPRYFHFVNDTKAYITDLYSNRIAIVNTLSNTVTGYINTGCHKSTEAIVQCKDKAFVNCWSYDNKILVIDTKKDLVVDSVTIGFQPKEMVMDKNNKLWVITDGSLINEEGASHPSLYKIDAASLTMEYNVRLPYHNSTARLAIDSKKEVIYLINNDIWKINVDSTEFPQEPFIKNSGTIFYSLAVDPNNDDIYVGDAIDYVQRGIIYRFTADATPVDTFKTGIIPASFCFK